MAYKKNASAWLNMTVVEKFKIFMTEKMYIFASSFHEAFYAVKNIVHGHQDTDDGGQDPGSSHGQEGKANE